MIAPIVVGGDAVHLLGNTEHRFDLTFLDPPFNQGKEYLAHDDNMDEVAYWAWMWNVCQLVYRTTVDGGAVYFMHREKNAKLVIQLLEETGWTFRNLIIWKKMASATPVPNGFGKSYQIIVYAIKGERARVFNKLRIDPPLAPHQKIQRENGVYVTDVWDDIRELTSGYFAGEEPLRGEDGGRMHNQQSPIGLLARIILSSTMPGDFVLDPFAGTGTTLVVASQLERRSLGVELEPTYVQEINRRINFRREADDVFSLREEYRYTAGLQEIFPLSGIGLANMDAGSGAEQLVLPME